MVNCDHLSPLGDYLYQLYKSQVLCDLSIITRTGTTVLAHKLVVAAFSGAVRTEVEKWKDLPQVSIVVDCEVAVLMEFLDYMYTGNLHLSEELFPLLQNVSHGLQIPSLQKYLEEYQTSLTRPSNGDDAQEGEVTGIKNEYGETISDISEQTNIGESNEKKNIDQSNEGREITVKTNGVNGDCCFVSGKVKNGRNLEMNESFDSQSFEMCDDVGEEDDDTSADVNDNVASWEGGIEVMDESPRTSNMPKQGKQDSLIKESYVLLERIDSLVQPRDCNKTSGKIDHSITHDTAKSGHSVIASSILVKDGKNKYTLDAEHLTNRKKKTIRHDRHRHLMNHSQNSFRKLKPTMKKFKKKSFAEMFVCKLKKLYSKQYKDILVQKIGYSCKICRVWDKNVSRIKLHINLKHRNIKPRKLKSTSQKGRKCISKKRSKHMLEKRKKIMKKIEQKIKNFECFRCDKSYSGIRALASHLIEKHKIRSDRVQKLTGYPKYFKYKKFSNQNCKECNISFDSLSDFRAHCRSVHKKKRLDPDIACSYENCSEKFLLESELLEHIVEFHKTHAKKSVEHMTLRRGEVKVSHGAESVDRYNLSRPEKEAKHQKILTGFSHKVDVIKQTMTCVDCERKFTNLRNLSNHLQSIHMYTFEQAREVTGYPSFFNKRIHTKKVSKNQKFQKHTGNLKELEMTQDTPDKESPANEKLPTPTSRQISLNQKKKISNVLLPSEKDRCVECPKSSICTHKVIEKEKKQQKTSTGYSQKVDVIKQTMTCVDCERNFTNLRNLANHLQSSIHKYTFEQAREATGYPSFVKIKDTSGKESSENALENFTKAIESQMSSYPKKAIKYKVILPSKKYTCNRCPKSSVSRNKLIHKNHREIIHKKILVSKLFASQLVLKKHICQSFSCIKHLSKKPFQQGSVISTLDSNNSDSPGTLLNQSIGNQKRCKGNQFTCLKCGLSFQYYSSASLHFKKKHGNLQLRQRAISSRIKKHVDMRSSMFSRELCLPKTFSSKRKFSRHLKSTRCHTDYLPLEQTGYTRKVDIRKQTKTCVDCKRSFTALRGLANHLQSSVHMYTFEQAREATGYPSHIKIIDYTTKVSKCQKCSVLFPTMKDLKAHTVAVHGIPCKFCDQTFSSPFSLKRHGFRKHREHIKEFQMITYTFDKEMNEACDGEIIPKARMASESQACDGENISNDSTVSESLACDGEHISNDSTVSESQACDGENISKASTVSESQSSTYQKKKIKYKVILPSKKYRCNRCPKSSVCRNKLIHKNHREIRHKKILVSKLFASQLVLKKNMCKNRSLIKSVTNNNLNLTSKSEIEDIEKISGPKVGQEPKVIALNEMSADVAGLTQEPKVVVVKEKSANMIGLTHYFKDENNSIEPLSDMKSNIGDQLTLMENSALIDQNNPLNTIDNDSSGSLNNSSIINEKQKKCKRNQFTCLKCGLSFPYYSMASLHLKKKHGRHQLRQRVIFSRMKKHVSLRRVLFSRDTIETNTSNILSDEKRQTKCDICDRTFSCVDTLAHHLVHYHTNMTKRAMQASSNMDPTNMTKPARRTSSNLGKQRIRCVHCRKSLKYPRTHAAHLQIVHHYTVEQAMEVTGYPSFRKKKVYTKKPTKCLKCSVIFPTLKEYKAHEMLVHSIPCKICGEKFSNSWLLKRHWIKKHPENVHDLEEMKTTSLTRIAEEEENRKETEQMFKCDNCDFTTRELNVLSSHILESHPEVKPCCSVCGYVYSSQDDVELHMNECNRKTKTYQEKCSKYKCDVDGCKTITYTLANFNHHKKMHTREKKYSCDECQFMSSQYSHLLRHVRSVHRRLRPHLCESCGKAYSAKKDLIHHIANTHTRDSHKFQCEYCPTQTTTKNSLQNHLWHQHKVKMAGDERQYFQCDQCTYQTPNRKIFANHMNSHNNVRNYICDQCDARFVTMKVLITHMKFKHSTKDQHKVCSQCGYRAKTKNSLNLHIRVQHQLKGIKPYKCDYCDFRCATSGNCRKHIMGKHKGSPVHYTCDKKYLEKARNERKAGNTNQLFD
ncbi:KRAB [Mytilus edulis]|uniref:KRAB n=1 Tax=Mytilus edulis TaxID=6550 RepID=A0A8S3SPI8_MYTED|nr:KRAB [Mytilus edulis]